MTYERDPQINFDSWCKCLVSDICVYKGKSSGRPVSEVLVGHIKQSFGLSPHESFNLVVYEGKYVCPTNVSNTKQAKDMDHTGLYKS